MTAAEQAHQLWPAAHAVDRRRARSRQKKLGASSVGECRRRAGYIYAGTTPSNVSDNKRAAIIGTWLHKGLLDALRKEYGARIEITVESDEVRGHADAYYPPLSMLRELPGSIRAARLDLPEEGIVEDAKTKSVYVMDRVRDYGPSRANLYQVHIYADLLRRGLHKHRHLPEGPLPVAKIRLRYLCRDNGDEWVHEQPYDQAITDEAYEWLSQVYEADGPDDLPRDHDGPGLSVICDNCPFLDLCWPVRDDGRKRQAVLIHDDDDVAAALSDYDRGRALEKEGKELKAKTRAMLDAAEPGQYGELVLSWSGGRPKSSEDLDMDAVRALYAKAGLQLPTVVKDGFTSRTIAVKTPKLTT